MTESRIEFQENSQTIEQEGGRQGEEISLEEIKTELKKMRNKKAPGPGGLPIELIKHAPEQCLIIIQDIFNQCLNGTTIPSEWKLGYLSSIHKKGNRKNCDNYRGITVTSSLGRLYGRILKGRVEREAKEIEEQSGFRPGRSCVDNIFSLKQIVEKRLSRSQESHIVFIDLKKAYDSVPQQKLWEIMSQSDVNKQYTKAIKNMYHENQIRINNGKIKSLPFTADKGLKQGCCLSPTLFKIYIQGALRNWLRKCKNMGIKIGQEFVPTLLFADDQLILAEDKDDAIYMVRKLIEEYDQWGLDLNMQKTKYMAIGTSETDITTEYGDIESVQEYKYLGVTITNDGRDNKDILDKTLRGRRTIKALHPVIWNKHIRKNTKKMIYQTIVESTLTYGSEAWVLNKDAQRRLLATEMEFWRRSCGITRMDRVRSERIIEMMKVEYRITDAIQEKQLRWYGHLERMEDSRIPKKVWEWMPERRRKKGRPRFEWKRQIKQNMEHKNLEEDDWWDREKWKTGCDKRQHRL